MSSAVTEAHECEIEAMSYEMFAQHFMQDAWSTGHMWKRFGYPQLAQFPTDVVLDSAASPPDLSALSPNARRAAIALTTGVIAGEIHGARALIEKHARPYGLNIPEIDDDPLNAPTYRNGFAFLTKDTQWSSINGIFSGGGDLYWWPRTGPSIYIDGYFSTQREGLLNCTAASMLEVYKAGSQVHGAIGEQQQAGALLATVPDGDACWTNYATNEAMSAAQGLNLPALYYLPLSVPVPPPTLRQLVTGNVNKFVLRTIKSSFGLPKDNQKDTSQEHAIAIAQRDLFIARLGDKMSDDARRMRQLYDYNERKSPLGTESARGVEFQTDGSACSPSARCPLSVFGVPPMPDAPSNPSAPRGVDYVDSLVSQTDISTETSAPTAQFSMSRLFWRANLQRTCFVSGSEGFGKVLALRSKCQAAATQFGDADACTQCIALAEPHVPNCGSSPSAPIGPSKCSTLGADPSHAGMPAVWFDNAARWNNNDCNDAYTVAFAWCTGTQGLTPEATTPAVYDSEMHPLCDGSPLSLGYGTFRYLLATELDESEGDFNNNPWAFPMSTVRKEWTTFTPGSDPCDVAGLTIVNSFDSTVSKEISPAKIGNYNHGYLAGPRYPRCGVLQKRWWANEVCTAAASDVGFSPSNLGFFSPSTGEESYQVAAGDMNYCMLREPRYFKPTCSNGATCNAGGECVTGSEPAVDFLSPPPPPQ